MNNLHDDIPLNLMLDDIVSAVGQILVHHLDTKLDNLKELNGEDSAKQKVERVKRQLAHAKTSLASIKASNARKKHLNALAVQKKGSLNEYVKQSKGVNQTILSTSGKVIARLIQSDDRTIIYKNNLGEYVGRYVKGVGTFDHKGRKISREDVGLMLIGLDQSQMGGN